MLDKAILESMIIFMICERKINNYFGWWFSRMS